MKNFKIIFSIFILFIGVNVTSNAQCSDDAVVNGCGKTLKSGFTYLKVYDVDLEAEYSYVFSKGNMYFIQSCEQNSLNPQMKISILDRTKHKIASNVDKKTGAITANFLGYKCSATSIYYVKFEIDEDADKECGVGILGFK